MSDLISRQEAIDAIDRFNCFGYVEEKFIRLAEAIKILPSAEKKGEWIGIDDYPHEDWECSVCGGIFCGNDAFREEAHFCPNCGARMEGEDDGKDTTN